MRLHIRAEPWFDIMVSYIDIGIVIAAERFTPLMWEQIVHHTKGCDVRIISTRGGGDLNIDDMGIAEVAGWFRGPVRLAVNCIDCSDMYTFVGHTDTTRAQLTVKGKYFKPTMPFLWLACDRSVRQFQNTRMRSKGKGNTSGKHKGNGKRHDKNGKGNDRGRGKGKGVRP